MVRTTNESEPLSKRLAVAEGEVTHSDQLVAKAMVQLAVLG